MLTAILTAALLQAAPNGGAPLTIEEYLAMRQPREVRVAPDGAAVLFTVVDADLATNAYRTRLYVWDAEGVTRLLAPGFADVRSPRWSPDGAFIAFLSRGPEGAGGGSPGGSPVRIWLLRRGSEGPATPLGELPGPALEYGWAPDGSIYALSTGKDGHGREFWRLEIPDGTAEHIWDGDSGVRDMAVSPDGRAIVFSTNGSGAPDDYLNYDLWLLDLESRRVRELTARPGPETAPVWSPDSRTIVFRAPLTPRFPYSQSELFSVPAEGGPVTNLTDSFDRTVLVHAWPPGGDLLFTAAVGTATRLFAVRRDGGIEPLADGVASDDAFDAGVAGAEVYVVRGSATEPPELWRIGGSGPQRLTRLNERAAAWKLARQEVVRWTAPDGLSVEGVLVYPADYEEGRRYPLLVHAAGGPGRRARSALDPTVEYQVLAAQGYAVLTPNFRGSRGYGEAFAMAPPVDLAGGDLADVLAGVDHVIGLGLADSTRLGIYGGGPAGPYGAYLTTWAITQTQRFGAAVAVFGAVGPEPGDESPGAGPTPPEADYLEMLDRQRSPFDLAAAVRTPLLLVEVRRDGPALVSRARRLFRTLADLGRPVEYVEVGGTGAAAGPRERAELFLRRLRWFDRHLKFGGADLFAFYLVGEWTPGPEGWRLRVEEAVTRSDYSGLRPDSGRYLELTVALRPDEAAAADGTVPPLELDPTTAVTLVGPGGSTMRFAGTVTRMFDRETLIMGSPGPIVLGPPARGSPATFAFRFAFEIPERAAEYRLRVAGFAPVRIWVGPGG